MFGRRAPVFGRKGGGPEAAAPSSVHAQPDPAIYSAPRDSDGRRRVFGEAIFETHGDFLREIGFDIDDPKNIVPEREDFDRAIKDSLARQEERRCAIEAELLARHGVNNIRPFFVLAEGVYNSPVGNWLIQAMNLLPYEDWNVIYLPNDSATAAAMELPLHPRQAIGPIDELMATRMGEFRARLEDGHRKVSPHVGTPEGAAIVERFLEFKDKMRRDIVDYVGQIRPMLIELIADVQSKGAGA